MPIGSAVALNDNLRPREQRTLAQLRAVRARVRAMLGGSRPPEDTMACDDFDREFNEAMEAECRLQNALALSVASRECDECQDGHLPECPALEPCEDLYDVLWRHQCDGCCPNGCRERGLQLLATVTGRRFSKMLGVTRK